MAVRKKIVVKVALLLVLVCFFDIALGSLSCCLGDKGKKYYVNKPKKTRGYFYGLLCCFPCKKSTKGKPQDETYLTEERVAMSSDESADQALLTECLEGSIDVRAAVLAGGVLASSIAMKSECAKNENMVDSNKARKWFNMDDCKACDPSSYSDRGKNKQSDVRCKAIPTLATLAREGLKGSSHMEPVTIDRAVLYSGVEKEEVTSDNVNPVTSELPQTKALHVFLTEGASDFVKTKKKLKNESKDIIAGWDCSYQYMGKIDIKNHEDKLGVTIKGYGWEGSDYFKISRFVKGEGNFVVSVAYKKSESGYLKVCIPEKFKGRCTELLPSEEKIDGVEINLLLSFSITDQVCFEIESGFLQDVSDENFIEINRVDIYKNNGVFSPEMDDQYLVYGCFCSDDDRGLDNFEQEIKVLPDVVKEGFKYKKECFYLFNRETFSRKTLDKFGLFYVGVDGSYWKFSKLDSFSYKELDFKCWGVVYDEYIDESTPVEL